VPGHDVWRERNIERPGLAFERPPLGFDQRETDSTLVEAIAFEAR
jgi:hypothetical protein